MIEGNTSDAMLSMTGASDEARYLQEAQSSLLLAWKEDSAYLNRNTAHRELADIWQQCRAENWDGCGGEALDIKTLLAAKELIDSIPAGITTPEVGIEPDGHIGLDWYRARNRVLSVSVSPDGMLYYAAIIGSRRCRGSEPFYGVMPTSLVRLIHEVCSGVRPQQCA
jgi:hypothetical protein